MAPTTAFPRVEVLTPEGEVFYEEIEMLSTRTTVGSIGMLANHEPLLATLEPTELRLYRSESEIVRFAQAEGYLQFADNRALVLVEEAIPPSRSTARRSAGEARRRARGARARPAGQRGTRARAARYSPLRGVSGERAVGFAGAMNAPPDPHFKRPGWFTKNVFNRIVAGLTRLGISVWGSRVLEVRGRTSGQWRRTPVNLLALDGERYLVAPRGRDAVGAQPARERRGPAAARARAASRSPRWSSTTSTSRRSCAPT